MALCEIFESSPVEVEPLNIAANELPHTGYANQLRSQLVLLADICRPLHVPWDYHGPRVNGVTQLCIGLKRFYFG